MLEIKYLNHQWYVKTDPNQLPEEELVFESFEQVSRFVEGDQGQLLIEADDSCPRQVDDSCPRPEENFLAWRYKMRILCRCG